MDPRIRSRSVFAHHGVSDATLARRRRSESWLTLRRGHFVDATVASSLNPHTRHRLHIGAAAQCFGDGAVFSHLSAAVLHGIAIWSAPLDRVHVTRNRSAGGRSSASSVVHATPLHDDEVTEVDGLAVTSVARTVSDLARRYGFETGVVGADDTLHRGLLLAADLSVISSRARGLHGAAAVRAVTAFAEGRSESPGESRSRVRLSALGVGPMDLQRRIVDEHGHLIARADFYFEGHVVGEFDGMTKYGRLLSPGESAGDAVTREKIREDRIRATNRIVVRWTWSDLSAPALLGNRIKQAIARGRAMGSPTTP
ncbi:hypothetical protein FZI91_16560 [Mycobacterium sp. CBMA271]|uniref:hypothetical protein n=1 Tax=unclassified Mycobacteroides TaxID=2618759 RepID=UPI0012DFCA3F|nr:MULTISPECIES: hypothetical protein [unclassified Mycobacteroides]MUM17064.1 hypothetical protein [Mycobacteroides sp. CBMA 326]MUM23302.1 hypothetical protein [Mycobacteroides sp. CBMA 271]